MTDIIDAHHHIWRRRDLPWLDGPMQPRIFGPYEAIRRDYLIDEYLSDLAGTGVTQSVYVQCNWAKDRFEDEVAYVQQAANETGFPQAIVGYADFSGKGRTAAARPADQISAACAACACSCNGTKTRNISSPRPLILRAIRRCRETSRSLPTTAGLSTSRFSPDRWKARPNLPPARRRSTFILQHAGMLEDLSPDGWARWRKGMRRLAAQPNIVSKLSALGTFIHKNDPDHIAAIVRETIDIFGPARCLFGSNFPVEKLWTGYADLIAAYRSAIEPLGEASRARRSATRRREFIG